MPAKVCTLLDACAAVGARLVGSPVRLPVSIMATAAAAAVAVLVFAATAAAVAVASLLDCFFLISFSFIGYLYFFLLLQLSRRCCSCPWWQAMLVQQSLYSGQCKP